MTILYRPSPNFTERRRAGVPRMILLHYTAMASAEAALQRLCAPEFQVSAHFLIDQSGQVFQLVHPDMRAWHAGQSYWAGETDINSASIGIELCNSGKHPYPAAQMSALRQLLDRLCADYAIDPRQVWGHSDVALGRKTDPGARFDWRSLSCAGFGIWPRPDLPDVIMTETQFLDQAARVGYDRAAGLAAVLAAVRLHFAPMRRGPLNGADCRLIHDLAEQING